jgi:hypothetical protein
MEAEGTHGAHRSLGMVKAVGPGALAHAGVLTLAHTLLYSLLESGAAVEARVRRSAVGFPLPVAFCHSHQGVYSMGLLERKVAVVAVEASVLRSAVGFPLSVAFCHSHQACFAGTRRAEGGCGGTQ